MDQKTALTQRVVEYLESQKWKYQLKQGDDDIILLNIRIACKLDACDVLIAISNTDIQTFTISPLKATPDTYANTVEYITRINYTMKLGRFDFDYQDGEVRYGTCLRCSSGVPSLKDIERCVDTGLIVMQHYGDGLVKNMMGFGNPKEDIAAIDGKA